MTLLHSSTPKILVVRPDAIGDVVLITPLLVTLKQTYPNSRIYTLQQPYTTDIFTTHPAVEATLVCKWKSEALVRFNKNDFRTYVAYLKTFNFDMVILPFLDDEYASLMKAANIPIRIGDGNKLGLRRYLTHKTSLNLRYLTQHETELNTQLFSRQESSAKISQDMTLYTNDTVTGAMKQKLNAWGYSGGFLIGIHPTTGGGNRAWTPEKYARLITQLATRFSCQILLTGAGQKDCEVAEKIEALTDIPLLNIAGKTSLIELMSVVSLCHLMIGTDTGPTHLAAGFQVPVLCISPTKFVKSLRWGPWGTRNIIVGNPSACQLVCDPYRCSELDCLDAIDINTVITAAAKLKAATPHPTIRENKIHWLTASCRVLLYARSKEALQAANTAELLLSKQGYAVIVAVSCHTLANKHALLVLPPWDIYRWIRTIQTHDITVVHSIKRSLFFSTVIKHISALKMYVPPIFTKGPVNNFSDMLFKAFSNA